MCEVSTGVEKDPYMQAYITARMKNQVEEMKLQKILSTMEVSQRVRKIMLNLEMYEDRRIAHKLQREVMDIANRQRKAMNFYLKQKGSRQRLTAAWMSTMLRSDVDHTVTNSSVTADQTQAAHVPHPPDHPFSAHPHSQRAVYPVTKGREYGYEQEVERSRVQGFSSGGLNASNRSPREAAAPEPPSIPLIQITDTSVEDGGMPETVPGKEGIASDDHHQLTRSENPGSKVADPEAAAAAVTSSAKAVNVTSRPSMTAPQLSEGHPHHATPHFVHFPPVSRSPRTVPARSLPTPRSLERKRVNSAASIWAGDPRAIRSVRRDRKNIDEMIATMKAGEETRRLIREARPSCSRNCGQPGIMSLLGRTYVNLPDLLPEIEKARQRLAEEEAAARDQPDFLQSSMSSEKRKSMGRFDLDDEEVAPGSKNLPIYHINYASLREIGGTRRNSVLA